MVDKLPVVYLDNNATTELSDEVTGVIMDMVLHNIYGNPSSQHERGSKIRTLIDAARYGVAQSLRCKSDEIVFTSGGTEANNLAIKGVYPYDPEQSDSIVTSAVEHSSVSKTLIEVAGPERVRTVPLNLDGSINMDWVERLIDEDTNLVSIMLANNETGVVFPIKEIADLAHSCGALLHCDAVQAYGKIPIDVKSLGIDLLSISGHKAHALPGIGALYVRKGVQLHPLLVGGRQEGGLRAGTENYVGIASLGTVANDITRRKGNMESGLRDAFELGIRKRIPDIVINGEKQIRVPNTSSITFKGIHAISMLTALNEQGIQASAGPACSSGSAEPSKTLLAMGVSREDALSTIRFSFSNMSSFSDASSAIEACVRCASVLRQSGERFGS